MNDKQLVVKMALDSWQGQVKAMNNLLEKLSDEQLAQEISPNKNRGIYLLGHLTTVHDLMLPLLQLEDPIYPDLQPVYVDSPDRSVTITPLAAQLRAQWVEVNKRLLFHFNKLPADDWFTRHANITDEDFIKEPHRNRLNVLMGRTVHLSYHRGQLRLLLSKT
jgi:uncharacterized damage-inducible protein DinB